MLRKFNETEILEIVAKYASESLPENFHGLIDGKYDKKTSIIEIYFIQSTDSSDISS